jgi:hypothetical protein
MEERSSLPTSLACESEARLALQAHRTMCADGE